MRIKSVFNDAVRFNKLRSEYNINEVDMNRIIVQPKEPIEMKEEFTEGANYTAQSLPYLFSKSSWYWLVYFKYLYSVKRVKKSESVVLDLGCGQGIIGDILHRGTYLARSKYICIDAVKNKLEKAFNTVGGNVLAIQMHLKGDLSFIKSNSVDVVIALEIIEHMTAKQGIKFIKEIYRVCKPGGDIIISTPNKESVVFSDEEKEEFKHGSHIHDFHVYEYGHTELARKMKRRGMQIINMFGVKHKDRAKPELLLSEENQALFNKLSKYHSKPFLRNVIMPVLSVEYSVDFVIHARKEVEE